MPNQSQQTDELASSFAATLTFTNGICPMCKAQVYNSKPDFTIIVDIDEGIKHFQRHSKKEQKQYKERLTTLKALP